MFFYEIPYEVGNTEAGHLDGLVGGRREFDTRLAAIEYAMQSASALVGSSPDQACIAIQGPDGRWRTFDPDLSPII